MKAESSSSSDRCATRSPRPLACYWSKGVRFARQTQLVTGGGGVRWSGSGCGIAGTSKSVQCEGGKMNGFVFCRRTPQKQGVDWERKSSQIHPYINVSGPPLQHGKFLCRSSLVWSCSGPEFLGRPVDPAVDPFVPRFRSNGSVVSELCQTCLCRRACPDGLLPAGCQPQLKSIVHIKSGLCGSCSLA